MSPVPGAAEAMVRPWGAYQVVEVGDGYQIKRLEITLIGRDARRVRRRDRSRGRRRVHGHEVRADRTDAGGGNADVRAAYAEDSAAVRLEFR